MKLKTNTNQKSKKINSFFSLRKFIAIALLLIATNSFAQLVNENFEGGTFPPTGWTESNNTGLPWALSTSASAYGVGLQSIMMNFYYLYTGSETINTPVFTAAPSGSFLQFDEAYAGYAAGIYYDSLQILTSSDGGITFTPLVVLHGGDTGALNTGGLDYSPFIPAANQWQTFSIAIPAGTNMIQFMGMSAYGNDLYLDNIVVEIPCSGTPVAGTAATSSSSICSGNSFTLSLTGSELSAGLTYQWQSSTDNINFYNINGATTSNFTTSATTNTYYHCIITCTNSGLSATSSSVEVTIYTSSIPFTEDFESGVFPPNCWTTTHNSVTPWVADASLSAYGLGSHCAMIDLFHFTSGNEQLTTFRFVPTIAGYMLKFDEAYASRNNANDQLQVLYSTDFGVTFNQLVLLAGGDNGPLNTGGDVSTTFVPNGNQWHTLTYALPIGTNMISFNAISANGNELYLDNISVNLGCSGIPIAGTTVSTTNFACVGFNFTLSLSGASNSPGITYQWQSSPNNTIYTNVNGATNPALTTSENASTWFQCVVTCSNSGLTATSTPVPVNVNISPLPFIESFESGVFPPTCWSQSNTTFPWYLSSTASAYGVGTHSSVMNFFNLISGNEYLNTFLFVPSTAGYALQFDEAYASNNNSLDQLQISTSSDGGATYTQLVLLNGGDAGPLNTGGDITSAFSPNANQWQKFTYPIPVGTNMIQFNGISNGPGNNLYIDNASVIIPVACSGTPVAGTAVSSFNPVNVSQNFFLSLSGADNTTGLTYQWQSSPDNIVYSNIVGATSATYTTSELVSTWYRCIVTCSNSGLSSNSNPVQVDISMWTPIVNLAPDYNGGGMLLLSDGTVICKTSSGGNDGIGSIYDRLTPDSTGSYVNGTWTQLAPMNFTRLYYSSQLLKDGRVYVAGGEYGSGSAQGEVWDPNTNVWTVTQSTGYGYIDANSELLPNGKVLQSCEWNNVTFEYDPITNTYSNLQGTLGTVDESAWIKQKDSSILYVNMSTYNTERYIPSLGYWIADADVPVMLYDGLSETGPGFLLPDGRTFYLGGSGQTAYYTPSGNTSPGTWTAGPVIPMGLGASDAGGSQMVDGKILCCFNAAGSFNAPTYYFIFDYLTNTFNPISAPNGASSANEPCYYSGMLNLPDGTTMYSDQGQIQYYIYKPAGAPLPQAKPTIGQIFQTTCDSFSITGTLFNGINEGSGYGDDWQMATNYPIIRLKSTTTGNVYYAKTFNWNLTDVATGSTPTSTEFTIPSTLPLSTYWLWVTANGVASDSVLFTPFPLLSSTLTPPAICSGDTFNYTPVSIVNTATLTWTRAAVTGISNAAITNPQSTNPHEALINTTANPISVVYAYAITANGCTIYENVTVVVNPAPVVTISGTTVLCAGNSTTLTATGGPSYLWSTGSTSASITVVPIDSEIYTVTVTNGYGCNTVASQMIIVHPNPVPVITPSGPTAFCQGDSVSLICDVHPSYNWSTGSTSDFIEVTTSGTYTVTVSNVFGCTGTASYTVTVYPLPAVPTITIHGDTLHSSSATGNQWYLNNVMIGGATNQDYIVTQNGNYTVTVTDAHGCSASSTIMATSVGINEIKTSLSTVVIYPNPNDGNFTISNVPFAIYDLRITDVIGKEVYRQTITNSSNSNIDISQLSNGIYFWEVINDKEVMAKGKIALQK